MDKEIKKKHPSVEIDGKVYVVLGVTGVTYSNWIEDRADQEAVNRHTAAYRNLFDLPLHIFEFEKKLEELMGKKRAYDKENRKYRKYKKVFRYLKIFSPICDKITQLKIAADQAKGDIEKYKEEVVEWIKTSSLVCAESEAEEFLNDFLEIHEQNIKLHGDYPGVMDCSLRPYQQFMRTVYNHEISRCTIKQPHLEVMTCDGPQEVYFPSISEAEAAYEEIKDRLYVINDKLGARTDD